MIELTPLEVRQKKNDFRRVLRGYDPESVDDFLETVASHLDVLVRERMRLTDELEEANKQVVEFRERERALTEALVTAQKMRDEVRSQAEKEGELIRREALAEAERIRKEARSAARAEEAAFRQLQSRRLELIRTYRRFLEREMNELVVLEQTLELDDPESRLERPNDPEPRLEREVTPVAVVGSDETAGGATHGAAEPQVPAGEAQSVGAVEEVPSETATTAIAAVDGEDSSPVPAELDLSDALSSALGEPNEPPANPGPTPIRASDDFEFLLEPDDEGRVGDSDAGGESRAPEGGETEVGGGEMERGAPPADRPRQPDWLESLLREEG